VTWPPPEPATGAALGLKLLGPEEELAEPVLAPDRLAEGSGAAGRSGTDGVGLDGLDVRCCVGLGVRADGPAAWADPGRIRATAPVVTTLAVVTAVVTERIRAWPCSLALIARRALSRFALLKVGTVGEAMQGS
jgi:hypothetical protein